MILAIRLIIFRICVVMKTSVASMTSTDMITSLAFMTSIASVASKIKNNLHFTYWVIFLASEIPVASMASAASTTSVASMASSASFHQKSYCLLCFHQPWQLNDIFWFLNVWWIIKNSLFIDFWCLFFWRLWRTGKLLLTKLKGHRSNFHYSEFPNNLQTESNLHISICQNQIH